MDRIIAQMFDIYLSDHNQYGTFSTTLPRLLIKSMFYHFCTPPHQVQGTQVPHAPVSAVNQQASDRIL